MDGRVIAIDTPSGQPPALTLDSPTEGSAVAGPVTISGWALDSAFRPETRISGVLIYIDNVFQATAPYGYLRSDVCNAHASRPGCHYVGFSWQWHSGSVALGPHQIKIVAYDCDFPQSSTTLIRSVNVMSSTPPTATGAAVNNLTIADTATGTMDYYVFGVQNASSTSFPAWTDVNGQDDLIWYSGQNLGAGTWKGTVNLGAHPGTGGANVNVYLHNPVTTVPYSALRFTKDSSGWPAPIPGALPSATDAAPSDFTITAHAGDGGLLRLGCLQRHSGALLHLVQRQRSGRSDLVSGYESGKGHVEGFD